MLSDNLGRIATNLKKEQKVPPPAGGDRTHGYIDTCRIAIRQLFTNLMSMNTLVLKTPPYTFGTVNIIYASKIANLLRLVYRTLCT